MNTGNEDIALPATADAPGRSLKDEYKHEDHAFLVMTESPREYYTGSLQYASAESEVEYDESIGIQRMVLSPSGATHLRDRMERIKDESRLAAVCAKEDKSRNIAGPLHTFFEASMRRFHQ